MDSKKGIRCIKSWQADNELKRLLKSNKNSAWNAIYDKYSAVMYGNILNITKNKVLAEKIFVEAFKSLKEDNKHVPAQCSIILYLCAYAKKITIEHMNPKIPNNFNKIE